MPPPSTTHGSAPDPPPARGVPESTSSRTLADGSAPSVDPLGAAGLGPSVAAPDGGTDEPELTGDGTRIGDAPGAAVGPAVGGADGGRAVDRGVATGVAVGRLVAVEVGIGVAVGVGGGTEAIGVGVGEGTGVAVDWGAMTTTVGPASGTGFGPCDTVALNVTGQVPSGRVVVAWYVPSTACPLTSARASDVPATWALTELAANPWSLRYRTLKRKLVCVVPEPGETLPAPRVAAAATRGADPSQMDPTARMTAAPMRTDRWAGPSGEMAQDTG